MHKQHSGFTLIELMIVLAVAAIVLTLGVPSFQGIIERNGLAVQVNDFISSLNYARSEAVKRKQNVVVCRSDTTTNPLNCNTGTSYDDGWLIYIDFDRDNSFDVGTDEIVWTHDALKQDMQFYGTGNIANRIAFSAKGRSVDAITGSFILCKNNDPTKARVLVVSNTGRARITAIGPNGKAEDSSGTELTTC